MSRQRIQQLEAAESSTRPGTLWYVATRAEAAAAAAVCRACGLRAVHYHAGLRDSERRAIEGAWLRGALDVVCATRDSFGLGIDKANVSLVILAEGGGLHAWSQQLGRAGRNGEMAVVVTLAAPLGRPARAPSVLPTLHDKAAWAFAAERQTALVAAAPAGSQWASAGAKQQHLSSKWIEAIASAEGGLARSEATWRLFALLMGEPPEATMPVAVAATAAAPPPTTMQEAVAAEALQQLLRLQLQLSVARASQPHTLAVVEGWGRGGVRDFGTGRIDAGRGACALGVHGIQGVNVARAAQRQLALLGLIARVPPPAVNPVEVAARARRARWEKVAQAIAARRLDAPSGDRTAAPSGNRAAVPSKEAAPPPPLLFHTLTPRGAAVAGSPSPAAEPHLLAATRSLLTSIELTAARASPTACWLESTVANCRSQRAAAADGQPPQAPRDATLEHLLQLRVASLPRLSPERLVWAALDDCWRQELDADEAEVLEAALREAGACCAQALAAERDRLVAVAEAEAHALVAAFQEQRRRADDGDVGASAFLARHPISRAGGTADAARALAARHRAQAIVQLVLCVTRELAPALRGVPLVQPGGRGMDGSASDVAAALGALDGGDATAARHDLVDGELRLPRRDEPLARMLRAAGAAAAGATARVTTTESAGCVPSAAADAVAPLARALASASAPQAAQACVSTSVADLFALGTDEGVRRASAARAARSLLRNLRVGYAWAAAQVAELSETELYRIFDVGACTYFSSQTAGVPSGHLIFVRQGKHGALSLV